MKVKRNNDKMFYAISAIIGAGKTTLVKNLSKKMNANPMYEPLKDNNYLNDFYTFITKYNSGEINKNINKLNINDNEKWMYKNSITFSMQIELLWKRYSMHQRAIFSTKSVIQDRFIAEDTIFAKMLAESNLMDKRDYDNYIGLYNIMKYTLNNPDLIIYLKTDPNIAYNRIMKRGRPCEKNMSLDYLLALNNNYEDYINEIKNWVPVKTYNWNDNINLENGDYDKLVDMIANDLFSYQKEYKNKYNFYRSMSRL